MKDFNVAILGCGTVGGGVARIIGDLQPTLSERASKKINLKKIVDLNPKAAIERFGLSARDFCGGGRDLTGEEATKYTKELIESEDIDLIVETIGGSNDYVEKLAIDICNSKKHLVTANKALLAERGKPIFGAALKNDVTIGYEAAVCGAIPIIKSIRESFTGDSIISVSGIMNGTSNYILSMMQNEGMAFDEALRLAQENGFAEADPSLDINGGDAGHKLVILLKLAFGVETSMDQLSIEGIENIRKEDIAFAEEIGCKIKLICYAKQVDGKIYATVCPMMVKNANFLSGVNGATNAVRLTNKYSGKHILLGAGAGSYETASSIVADIIFAAKYGNTSQVSNSKNSLEFVDARHFEIPYIITFETVDEPGITGIVTTSIGNQEINIDTVSHNRHMKDRAIFSIATTPCTLLQINKAIDEITESDPGLLLGIPKKMPILY
jgi:homoserine dehydrogenase